MTEQAESIRLDVSVAPVLDNIGIFEFIRRTNMMYLSEYKRRKRKRRYGYYVAVSSIH